MFALCISEELQSEDLGRQSIPQKAKDAGKDAGVRGKEAHCYLKTMIREW
jgi:hypothetical protein